MDTGKIIVILGPTASGKSDLAVQLAKKFEGEIISADSRQVYKGLDIGSGKITQKEMRGVPHHLLDVADPKRKFSVSRFQKLANKKIQEIQKHGKVPFLVGGTGFYIQSIVDGIVLPEVKPNPGLRQKLSQKTPPELFAVLQKLDPRRASTIDAKNPHRLIRAIEIATATKKPIVPLNSQPEFSSLQIGIRKPPEDLTKAIHKRLLKRLPGMITEVKKLQKGGLSWNRLEELGLEYRFVAQYLQKKISKQEMVDRLQKEIEHYAKRQMTWFKRDQRIHWVTNMAEANKLTQRFLK